MGSEGYRIIRAVGNGDQRIFIVPEKEIVVTVFAGNYNNFRHKSGKKVFASSTAKGTESLPQSSDGLILDFQGVDVNVGSMKWR